MKETIKKRFISYITIDSQSNEANESCPSTEGQFKVANLVKSELEALKLKDIVLDKNCYLTALLPSNCDKDVPAMGFIAHFDTAPDCSGANIKPQIVKNYDGGELKLGNSGLVLKPEEAYKGHDLITTDGTTLLGADDKAGVTEIVTAVEYLLNHPEIKHGDIYIGFTPDEEIGRGADLFPLDRFKAKWAYTVDGGPLGELEYENFNAASATVEFEGVSIHPGSAKDIMVNSQTLAAKFHAEMPEMETPEHTEGYDGFYHLTDMEGCTEHSKLVYIIRDFDADNFQKRQEFLKNKAAEWNKKLGAERVKVTIKESYRNMYEKVASHQHILDLAKNAMKEAGVEPKVVPIRGGTDGARLSYMGLPCPNIFTGGHNFHGKYEYISLNVMEKAVATIVNISKA
jgi:tripeptide aminopeptidase